MIDNIPLHRIHRATLRQRLIAVPQDPIFLPDGSSFCANLDPTNTATPVECQRVLQAVRLWDFVQEQAQRLHEPVTAGILSAGQRQLFSLGRAVLRAITRQRSTSCPPYEGSDNQDQGGSFSWTKSAPVGARKLSGLCKRSFGRSSDTTRSLR